MRSPKDKFYGEVTFEKPVKNIGSVVSHTADAVDSLIALLQDEAERIKCNNYHICIRENKKAYPQFEWVNIFEQNYSMDKNHRIRIGQQLAALRKDKGLSCEEVAEIVGTYRQTITKIENGKWSVSLDLLEKYANALNAEVAILKIDKPGH